MKTTYTYGGQVYLSAWQVRQAIAKAENKAFGAEPADERAEFWKPFGVTYAEVSDPEPTDEELAAAARRQRNYLISACDFLAMPDYPLSEEERSAVTAYRQALRDVPAQEGFPREITWPEAPAVLSAKMAKAQAVWRAA